jgi:L-ascorbate metabolism protein UlaG (beta-lactamase superfamily)
MMRDTGVAMVGVTLIGGPTAIVDVDGVRFLTDPTFDPPGDYPIGERKLTKLSAPALPLEAAGRVDAVLLSHDQHPDNLDRAGRGVVAEAPLTLSTPAAAARLGGNVRGLAPWEATAVAGLDVTAVPALHGPPGSERLVGDVTGFVIAAASGPTVYVSGDNASLDRVREIAARFPRVDVAVLFCGAARTALLGDAYLTLPSEAAVEAARLLRPRHVVPIHVEGWAHFSQGPDTIRTAFGGSDINDRLHLLAPGEKVDLETWPPFG